MTYLLEKLGLLVSGKSIEGGFDVSEDLRALETGNLDVRHVVELRKSKKKEQSDEVEPLYAFHLRVHVMTREICEGKGKTFTAKCHSPRRRLVERVQHIG
jgi:hypothetical protein